MKRRKFIATAAIAGIPVVSQASSAVRTYGAPGSLNGGSITLPKDGLLSIPIDDSFITPTLKNVTESISKLFYLASSDRTFATRLSHDPVKILHEFGLESYISPVDPLLDALRISAEPDLKQFLEQADYRSFMAQLKSKGLLQRLSRTKLKDFYVARLKEDQSIFDKYLKGIFENPSVRLTDKETRPYRVNKILSLIEQGTGKKILTTADSGNSTTSEEAVAAAVTVLYIAIGAITYVVAATQVIAALNVGTIVNLATRLSVTTNVYNPARSVVGQTKDTDEFSDIKALRNLQVTSFAAEISGRKDIVAETLRRTVNDEINAVIAAAEEIGLINFPRGTRVQIINEMKKLVHESVGLKG